MNKKNKKILLINSYIRNKNVQSKMVNRLDNKSENYNYFEEPYPSVGLLYIASSLRKENYDVSYLDIPVIVKQAFQNHGNGKDVNKNIDNLVEEITIRTYKHYKPDLVGINCLFSGKFSGSIFVSSILKRLDKNIVIVLGGIHPTIFHKEILERLDYVDFVIIGEGEKSFVQLLDSLFFNIGAISDIDGLCYRDETWQDCNRVNDVKVNPKRNFIKNLDSLPIPAWDILDMKAYEIDQENWKKFWHNPRDLILKYRMPLLTSRSCPMNCNFCAMKLIMGNKIRFRSANDVFEEIKYLYNDYDINYFSIIDDNFTVNKGRIIELANKIKNEGLGSKIYIDTPNGISMQFFDKEILEALKNMGLLRIYFAIESGSDHIRNEIMGKNLSKEKIFYISELMRKEKDIFIRAFFIVGMPQDTLETLEETWKMIKKLYIDDASIHFATPFPGTRLYEEVKNNNLLTTPEKDILFTDNYQLSSDSPFIRPYDLEVEELVNFKKKVRDLFTQRYKEFEIDRKYPIHHLL